MSQMRRLRDDMKMREEITDYYYQKGEKELGEWSQDDLLYTLLLRYVLLSDDFRSGGRVNEIFKGNDKKA